MKQTLPFLLALLSLCFAGVPSAFSQPPCTGICNPIGQCGSLAVSGGLCADSPAFFCEGQEVCVENNSDPASFDQWLVWWDDETCDIYPNTTNKAYHTYHFPDSCLLAGYEGISPAILIKNVRYCGPNNTQFSRNCVETYLLIKINPVASISIPPVLCKGQEACFLANGCENADTAFYEWHIDGMFAGSGLQSCKTFGAEGAHTVQLIMTNACGADTTMQNIWVRDVPEAMSSFTYSDSIGCIPAVVRLDDQSFAANSVCWFIEPGQPGWHFINSSAFLPDTTVVFDSAGIWQIISVAKNECGADTTMLEIETFALPSATIVQPDAACGQLLYQPDVAYFGSIDSTCWFLNGDPMPFSLDPFPEILLDTGIYEIVGIVKGRCGADTAEVTVTVNAFQDAVIEPVNVLCVGSEPIQLMATPTGLGVFGCSPFVSASGIFDPSQAGLGPHLVCYQITSALCPAADTIEILVLQGTSISVTPPFTVCEDSDPISLSPNLPVGGWSGSGVSGSEFFPDSAVGANPHLLTYTYQDPVGCTTVQTTEATVVALPVLSALDTISICAADEEMSLLTLAGVSVSPGNATTTCSLDGMDGCLFNPSDLDTSICHTVIFTATVPPGCSDTDTVFLKITELQQAKAPPDTTVCSGESLTLQGSPTGCAWSPQPFISTGGAVNTNIFCGAKTFTYRCNAGTFCETSDEVVVTVICNGADVPEEDWVCISAPTYDLPGGTPANGVWSGTALLPGNIVDVTQLTAGDSFDYAYTVASLPDACEQAVFTLHVAALPVVNFIHDSIGCREEQVFFINSTLNATHYMWNFGDGTPPSPNPWHTYHDTTGIFPVTLTAWSVVPGTQDILCEAVKSSTIHIYEPPQLTDFTAAAFEGCDTLCVTFDNLSLGENLHYDWDFGNGQTFSAAEPGTICFAQMVAETTFYEVKLSVWNDCDTFTVSHQITVLPRPHASFGMDFDEPCSGGILKINNTSTGNPAINVWTIHNLTLNTLQAYTSFNPPSDLTVFAPDTEIATVVITLTVTNDCGVSVFTDSVQVLPSPIVALFNYSAPKVCVGDTLYLADISTPGALESWDMLMSDGSPFHFWGETVAFVPTVAGEFTVTLYAEGCGYDSVELAFEAMPPPDLTVSYSPIAPCEGQAVAFEVATNGDGLWLAYGDNDSTDLTFSQHAYAGAGTYPLAASAQTAFGCAAEWSGSIEIYETPLAVLAFTDSLCAGATAIFTSEVTPGMSYEWQFCDTCYAGGATVSHVFPASGTFPVVLVAVSPFGCRDTTEAPFFVRPTPIADFEVVVLKKCTPAVFTLHDHSMLATGIEWQLSDGQTSIENTAEFTVEMSGALGITLVATNDGICFDTEWKTLALFETPVLTVTQEPTCTQAGGTDVSVETAASNFVSMSGEGYEQPGDFHPGLPHGEYLVHVISPDACEAETEVFVSPVQELFIHLAQYLFEIDMGQEVQLEAVPNHLEVTYAWSPAADLDEPTAADPRTKPLITTYFAVAVTNERGCVKYDTALVRVNIDREKGIFVPNTFTPNDDGHNDIFRFRSTNPGLSNINYFKIFDRWGELVFAAYDCQPETADCGWDGTFRGQKAEMQQYVWLAELEFVDGVNVPRKGEVMLIR